MYPLPCRSHALHSNQRQHRGLDEENDISLNSTCNPESMAEKDKPKLHKLSIKGSPEKKLFA
jgi:hypothetical protein